MPRIFGNLTQEVIVFLLAATLFVLAAAFLPGFMLRDGAFQAGNLILMVRSVSVLGILAVGMGIVIIGRGIDLSAVAVMAMSVAWYLQMLNSGVPEWQAIGWALAGVVAIGLINGFMVAYADVPAIFVTLASSYFVYGFVRSQLIVQDATPAPQGNWILELPNLDLVTATHIPIDVFAFAAAAFVGFLFLRFTKWGRYIYLMGDNYIAARNMGVPVRPITVLYYVISALTAFSAGILSTSSLQSMNVRVVNSNMLYDVILVCVIGGIGLSGGRGAMRNVIVGALLIGIMGNAMTILDFSNVEQNLIKSIILLAAIMIDGLLNQRDEQTAQQGDI